MMHILSYICHSDVPIASSNSTHMGSSLLLEVFHSVPLESNNIHGHNFLLPSNMHANYYSMEQVCQLGILFFPIVRYHHHISHTRCFFLYSVITFVCNSAGLLPLHALPMILSGITLLLWCWLWLTTCPLYGRLLLWKPIHMNPVLDLLVLLLSAWLLSLNIWRCISLHLGNRTLVGVIYVRIIWVKCYSGVMFDLQITQNI